MTIVEFNRLVEYIVNKKIIPVMCSKSEEYARNDDKLYNFKRSAEIDSISPIEALRGMDLKHRTNISDMLDDLVNGKVFSQSLWEEKLIDHLNYTILLYALLYELYGWEIKQ